MENVIVSIIVPAYNASKTIGACLESIVNQTYNNYEVIVINDGSVDDTLDIINAYEQHIKRITIIDKDNGGVSSARNIGLKNARGEYVTFVDADDRIEKTFLQNICSIKTHPISYDLVLVGAEIQSTEIRMVALNFEARNENEINQLLRSNYNSVLFKAPWAKLFKKSIIDDNDIRFDENLFFGEDSVFVMTYLSHCNTIRCIPQPEYIHNFRISGKYLLSWKNQLVLAKSLHHAYEKLYSKTYHRISIIEEDIRVQYASSLVSLLELKNDNSGNYVLTKDFFRNIPYKDVKLKNHKLLQFLLCQNFYYPFYIIYHYLRPFVKKIIR